MKYRTSKTAAGLLIAVLLLSACTSQIPQNIRQAPADNPLLGQVREQPPNYLGREVRWGGTIIETGNRENTTQLIVLGRPLSKAGEPEFTDDSAGRFIAIVPEFLDPKVYAPDRHVTVTGTLQSSETGTVGEYPYRYPVVQAKAWYLWPRQSERPYIHDDPWWYDPWYPWPWWHDPWYPYGYPYRHWH